MSENKIRSYREKAGYTQNTLAEKTGLSLRTIQRVEAGHVIPKGHTLTQLAEVFGLDPAELQRELQPSCGIETNDKLTLNLINLSTLGFFVFPFGNLVFPLRIWLKNRSSEIIDQQARPIINFQIIWTICLCVSLSVAPFLEAFLGLSVHLILVVLLAAVSINVFYVVKISKSIKEDGQVDLSLPFELL